RVTAIFTIVHRKSSRCSRNGLEVSLSGKSRNLKMYRSAIGQEFERCPRFQKRCQDAHALLKLTRNGDSRLRRFCAKRFGSARRLRIALIRDPREGRLPIAAPTGLTCWRREFRSPRSCGESALR